MSRSPGRRAVALLLELLLVALVFVGGGAECEPSRASAAPAAASHGGHAHDTHSAHVHDAHAQHAPAASETGEAHHAPAPATDHAPPACALMAVCAASLAPVGAVLIDAPVMLAAQGGPRAAPASPASALRAVETPPPRLPA